VNLKFWEWSHKREIRHQDEFNALHEAFISALTESLRHTQIGVSANHHITYSQKPPNPRPEQITLIWTFGDGHQYRQFFPLHGQSWIESIPTNIAWRNFENPDERPVSIEMAITYRDNGGSVR
jgi:hypothetical protein